MQRVANISLEAMTMMTCARNGVEIHTTPCKEWFLRVFFRCRSHRHRITKEVFTAGTTPASMGYTQIST